MIDKLRHLIRIFLCAMPFGERIVRRLDRLLMSRDREQRTLALHAHWREMYDLVHKSLYDAGIPYWFDFGSLLGLVRENGIIAHDEDADCCIPPEASLFAVCRALETKGFNLVGGFSLNGEITEVSFEYQGAGIDFFKCHLIGNGYGYYCFETKYDLRTCRPIGVVAHERVHAKVLDVVDREFGIDDKVKVSIPVNFDEVLQTNYRNWRVPDKKTNYSGGKVPCQYRDIFEGCKVLSAAEVKAAYAAC